MRSMVNCLIHLFKVLYTTTRHHSAPIVEASIETAMGDMRWYELEY